MNATPTWGIIRHAPGSGATPDQDAAAFDGWYRERDVALFIAECWAAEHPGWIVGLVAADTVWRGGGDFSAVRHEPLTGRERDLIA
jgi:hypothetical protein